MDELLWSTGSHNIGPRDPITSSLWAALCSLLNIQHSQTTAYHPQSNGMVDHFHRRLKDPLRARCTTANWVDHIPWGTAPAQAVFGPHSFYLANFWIT